jgi:hypothetical protein
MNIMLLGFIQFVLYLAAMGAFIAMIIILLLSLIEGAQAMSSRQWATATGMIVSGHVASERDEQDSKQTRIVFRPVVSYTYFVKGEQFVSDRIHFGPPRRLADREAGEKEIAAYPAGAPVNVYYNPEKPSEAVLKRESPAATRLSRLALAVIGGGIFSCIIGILLPQWVG